MPADGRRGLWHGLMMAAGLFAGLAASVGPVARARAQTAQQDFGRNRIQYEPIRWHFISTSNFDVYYPVGQQPLARQTAHAAEVEYQRISELAGYTPFNRGRIYVYPSPARAMGSNVGLQQQGSILGGKTSFIKNIVEVYYPGTYEGLVGQIAYGVARSVVYDMMYGGSFTEAIQNSYLMMLPEWFVEGAILFLAEGWSLALDDYTRQAGLARDLSRLSGKRDAEAGRAGQSLWAYIAERYGRANVSNVLNLTRIIRNEESALSSTLGVPYGRLLREWRHHYYSQAESHLPAYTEAPPRALTLPARERVVAMALSPDGRQIAWVGQRQGRMRVRMQNVDGTGRRARRRLWVYGERHTDGKTPPPPALSWAGPDRLAIVTYRAGSPELRLLSTRAHAWGGFVPPLRGRRAMTGLDHINSINYDAAGDQAVLSATRDGQTDLHLLTRAGRLRPLTQDRTDELDPVLSPKGSVAYFVANPLPDTTGAGPAATATRMANRGRMGTYQLFKVSTAAPGRRNPLPEPVLITGRAGHLRTPALTPAGQLVALSDETGITNLIRIDPDTTGGLVSHLATGLEQMAYNPTRDRAVGVTTMGGRPRLAVYDSVSHLPVLTPELSRWRLTHPARNSQGQIIRPEAAAPQEEIRAADPVTPTPPTEGAATTPAETPSEAPAVSKATPAAGAIPALAAPGAGARRDTATRVARPAHWLAHEPLSPDEIDIRRYVFESERAAPAQAPGSAGSPLAGAPGPGTQPGSTTASPDGLPTPGLSGAAPGIAAPNGQGMPARLPSPMGRTLQQREALPPQVSITGPFRYRNRLGAGNAITTFVIDPLPQRQWGTLIQVDMADHFENHHFTVRALPFLDLRNSVLALDYRYLARRVDFGANFTRSTYNINLEKNTLYRYQVQASYPLTQAARISISPFVTQTTMVRTGEVQASSVLQGDRRRLYTGTRIEAVYDNASVSSAGMMVGTRARIFFENHEAMRAPGRSFRQLAIDVRRYQRVHREVTLALRGSAGRFFGPAAKNYMLGGMDNWPFRQYVPHNRTDNPLNENNPIIAREGSTDLLFSPFVTNMRGFGYNALYGQNYLLSNTELRVPLVRYLYRGPIVSNFLRNLQLVGFYDIGSAWSGPFDPNSQTSVNTQTIQAQPITVTVRTFSSPFITGYGAGLRTLILGYYVKGDLAWGRQNGINRKPLFYLTLGQDF